jgi:hypothetical protein
MRAIFVGLVALSFTLVTIGCGGDPCADYQKKLCEDDKSKGACDDFKESIAKAKEAGTAGDMKKICETGLANWDKRGEGYGKNEAAAKKAAADMAAAKTACIDGSYTAETGCICLSDKKAQKIAKKDAKGKAVTKDGKTVWERSACPKVEPKVEPQQAPTPPQGAVPTDDGNKEAAEKAAALAAEKAAALAAEKAAALAAEKAAAPVADKAAAPAPNNKTTATTTPAAVKAAAPAPNKKTTATTTPAAVKAAAPAAVKAAAPAAVKK